MSSIVAARHGASLLYSIHTLYSMIIGVTHATTVTLSYLILTLEVTMNHESNRTPLLVQDISSSGM